MINLGNHIRRRCSFQSNRTNSTISQLSKRLNNNCIHNQQSYNNCPFSQRQISTIINPRQLHSTQEIELLPNSSTTTSTNTPTSPRSSDSFEKPQPLVKPFPVTRKPHKTTDNLWTKQEDDLLFKLRQQGLPWKNISSIVGRHVGSCYTRYYRFLDPFLADAIEDDPEEQARTQEAVKAYQKILENNVQPAILERSRDKGVISFPYHVQGPWTADDRERLEAMVRSKVSWSEIARELQRNQESCKEKWSRILKVKQEAVRRAKRMRSERRILLLSEGFAPYHRSIFIREIDRQLAEKRSAPLDLYNMNSYKSEGEALAPMMMRQLPDATSNGQAMGSEYQSPNSADTMEDMIDWEQIAGVLKNKFPVFRLKEIYKELAAVKLLWTPDEDERLIRAVVRLGPPERQPELWTMIKDAFGDLYRESNEYKDRWKELDMPLLDREWDESEKSKFWRRWLEFQTDDSLFSQPHFSHNIKSLDDTNISHSDSSSSSVNPTKVSKNEIWNIIADGLEFRHARDCQFYFESVTSGFPRKPSLFNFMTHELANYYTKPRTTHWTDEDTSKLLELAKPYLNRRRAINWRSISKSMGGVYTPSQCQYRWTYWTETQRSESLLRAKNKVITQGFEGTKTDNLEESLVEKDTTTFSRAKRPLRYWTDYEITLLEKGVRRFGFNWAKIRDSLLPHRTTHMLYDRYLRNQAKKSGKFTEQERSLLELAIETFGEGDWELIASQIPGRTPRQCRVNWRYGRTQHVQKIGEPWTELERERLRSAVKKFGEEKWVAISDFVIGKTPDQCRMEWRENLDPNVNKGPWSGKELGLLMEQVESQMSQKEEEENLRIERYKKLIEEGKKPDIDIEELSPRYKGKMKVDWNEIAKGLDRRTPGQCRMRFAIHRGLYYIQGNF